MNKCKSILMVYLWMALFVIARGQPLKVTRYSTKDGLETTAINDIIQDSIGFIWLATDDGLIRYDGKKFQQIKPGRYTFLAQQYNRLLVGNNSLYSISVNRGNDFKEKSLQIKSGILINDNRFVQFPSGELWWLDSDGIHESVNGRIIQQYFPEPGMNKDDDWVLTGGGDNDLWLMSKSGVLFKWEHSLQRFKDILYPHSFSQVHKLLVYDQHNLIVATNKGLFQLRVEDGHASSEILYDGTSVCDILRDVHGNLWIASSDGAIIKAYRENRSFVFRKIIDGSEPHRMSNLPFKAVKKLFCDKSNNLWLVHEGGLAMLSETPFIIINPKLPNEVVRSVAFMGKDKIYLSSIGGLYEAAILGHYNYNIKPVYLGSNLFPNAIGGFGNRLWIGASDNNLYYFENDRLSSPLNLKFRGSNTFYIFCDHDGNVWVSQAQLFKPIIGVLKVKPDLTVVEYNQHHGFTTRMLVTRQSPNGTIYCAGIGDTTYLYRYDRTHDRFTNISLPMPFDYGENFEVHDLAIDSDSTFWLATTAGLLKYKGKKIEKIQFPDLSSKEVVAVTIGKDGAIWASTEENGLVRIEKNGMYVVFNASAGIVSNIMWYRSTYTDRDGRIWAGSREGITASLYPSPLSLETETPISLSMKANGYPTGTRTAFDFQSTLAFDFVALNYPTQSITYQYKTEVRNNEWLDLRTNSTLKLDELENGRYTILIRAKQVGGYRWSKPLVYHFSINKPWYRNNYAVSTYVVILITLVIVSVRIYNRNLIREKKGLELMVEARTKQLTEKQEEIMAQNQELQQLSDELAAHNENILNQKGVIEKQNVLLNLSKIELERKVEDRTLELKLSNEELAQQNAQLEEFAFMTAHNLRAPVARLLGLSSLFDFENRGDHSNLELVRRMQQSAKDLDETIKEISKILHIKRGMHGSFIGVNLKNIFDKIVSLFREEIQRQNIVITSRILPTHVVTGIEPFVHSVFYNILGNNIRYMDEHRSSLIMVSVDDADDKWRIIIEDNGIGFDSDLHFDKLFRPFTRFNNLREGRGLGLYLVKIQMEMMHGSITVKSKINEGTIVTLNFLKF